MILQLLWLRFIVTSFPIVKNYLYRLIISLLKLRIKITKNSTKLYSNYPNIMGKIITRFKDSNLNKTTELTVEERFIDLVKRFYTSYSRKIIPLQFYQDNTSVKWSCYECKTEIIVNISKILNGGNFQSSKLFCEKHKPTDYKIYDSPIFIRHETVFYNYIKQSILKSSPLLTKEINENS